MPENETAHVRRSAQRLAGVLGDQAADIDLLSATLIGEGAVGHTAPDGSEWIVAVTWADVDGRAVPVGLDLRSYAYREGDELTGLHAPVSYKVIRSLRVADIIEATREQVLSTARIAPAFGEIFGLAASDEQVRRAERATEIGKQSPTKRPGRPTDRDDDFIATVAAYYREAKALGGRPARAPLQHVQARLADDGVPHVTIGQMKNWQRRAKRLGLLDTTNREDR